MDIKQKTRWVRAGLYGLGLVALLAFLLIRIRGGAEWIIYKPDYYNGRDLYKNHYIAHFRESHPAFDQKRQTKPLAYCETPEHPDLDEADILVFGDSFANFRWMKSYPEILRDRSGQKVYFAKDHYPLRVLRDAGYTGNASVVLFEIGERGIYEGFCRDSMNYYRRSRQTRERPGWFRVLAPGEAEQQYRALLQLNRFTHRIYKWIATKRFDWFGYISPITPVYALDPPVLYLGKTVDGSVQSFQYQHTQAEIDQICDAMAAFRQQMLAQHGLELVFVLIPNKISIHYEYVWPTARYNAFLPRLYKGLAQRRVPYVDLYTPFRAAAKRLYFLSDTHWNAQGVALAAQETLRTLAAQGLLKRPPPDS